MVFQIFTKQSTAFFDKFTILLKFSKNYIFWKKVIQNRITKSATIGPERRPVWGAQIGRFRTPGGRYEWHEKYPHRDTFGPYGIQLVKAKICRGCKLRHMGSV